jgi:hypothetical protein
MTVERLRIPTPEEALQFKRASATETCCRLAREGGHSLRILPLVLIEAFEVEAWKERVSPNGARINCADVMEWITSPFPRGIEASYEALKAILVTAADKENANKAANLLDAAVQRPGGNPYGRAGKPDDENTLYNIQSVPPAAPAGTSRDAGLRRLRKEAEAGNDNARDQLSEVLSGRKSVNRACVELGFRKGLDPSVRAQASRDAAEQIVGATDIETAQRISALLRKAGAANIANQIDNIIDPAIMDGGRL